MAKTVAGEPNVRGTKNERRKLKKALIPDIRP